MCPTRSRSRGLATLFRKRNPRVDINLVATGPGQTHVPGRQSLVGSAGERMALELRKADDQVKAAVP
jgi:hypothetical protein